MGRVADARRRRSRRAARVLTKDARPEFLERASDAASDWLMFSGNFVAGHVHRPAGGLRHDPHWILLGTSATECPYPRAGWANSIDEPKEHLLDAWRLWLEWAAIFMLLF